MKRGRREGNHQKKFLRKRRGGEVDRAVELPTHLICQSKPGGEIPMKEGIHDGKDLGIAIGEVGDAIYADDVVTAM